MARHTAETTIGKYVRLTPSRALNAAFSLSRQRERSVTSASIMHHACGIVDVERTMRSAIVLRICERRMTVSSSPAGATGIGEGACGAGARGGEIAALATCTEGE